MILVDTAIWIDHLHAGIEDMSDLLADYKVALHPFVRGEIALGNLRRRERLMADLDDLPEAPVGTDREVHSFIEKHSLFGTGIGYVDAHLLVSARLGRMLLWTRDKRLLAVAVSLSLASPSHKPH